MILGTRIIKKLIILSTNYYFPTKQLHLNFQECPTFQPLQIVNLHLSAIFNICNQSIWYASIILNHSKTQALLKKKHLTKETKSYLNQTFRPMDKPKIICQVTTLNDTYQSLYFSARLKVLKVNSIQNA